MKYSNKKNGGFWSLFEACRLDKHSCWLAEKTNRTNLIVMNGFI
jgi:hypothetical protein